MDKEVIGVVQVNPLPLAEKLDNRPRRRCNDVIWAILYILLTGVVIGYGVKGINAGQYLSFYTSFIYTVLYHFVSLAVITLNVCNELTPSSLPPNLETAYSQCFSPLIFGQNGATGICIIFYMSL